MKDAMSSVGPGLLAVVLVLVGAPLAAYIKGKFDRFLKKDDLEATAASTEDTQVRADLTAERTNGAEQRREMTVLREEADKERDLRVSEAEKYNAKAQTYLDDISKARDDIRRLLGEMGSMQAAHETQMSEQREQHRQQMAAMRARHETDLDRRDRRIALLDRWIAAGNPPPPPPWEEAT